MVFDKSFVKPVPYLFKVQMSGVEDGHSPVAVIAVAECGKVHRFVKCVVLFPV